MMPDDADALPHHKRCTSPPPSFEPTRALPGTLAKIYIMAARERRCMYLYNEHDGLVSRNDKRARQLTRGANGMAVIGDWTGGEVEDEDDPRIDIVIPWWCQNKDLE